MYTGLDNVLVIPVLAHIKQSFVEQLLAIVARVFNI